MQTAVSSENTNRVSCYLWSVLEEKKCNKYIHMAGTVLAVENNYFYVYKGVNNHQSILLSSPYSGSVLQSFLFLLQVRWT